MKNALNCLCTIIAASVLLACEEAPPERPIAEIAERFVADLGHHSAAAISPWLRDDNPAILRRRCPACPPERRLVERPLGFQAGGEALGAALRGDSSADTQGHIFRLRRGVQRCDGACCSWTVGLLEHGSTYLERACFGRDGEGARLTELTLVDG